MNSLSFFLKAIIVCILIMVWIAAFVLFALLPPHYGFETWRIFKVYAYCFPVLIATSVICLIFYKRKFVKLNSFLLVLALILDTVLGITIWQNWLDIHIQPPDALLLFFLWNGWQVLAAITFWLQKKHVKLDRML